MTSKLYLLLVTLFSLGLLCQSISQENHPSLLENKTLDEFDSLSVSEREEQLEAISSLASELWNIYRQIKQIRQIVTNSSRETIEVLDLMNNIDTSFACNRCQNFVAILRRYQSKKFIINIIEKALILSCELLQIDKNVCQGAIKTFGDILLDALIEKEFHPLRVCQRMLFCPQTTEKDRVKDYVKEVLKDKPPTEIPSPSKKASYKILQLSDPHVDLEYQEGSNAFCKLPLCCRAENGFPTDASKAAGHWGTLSHCDLPMRTFEQFLQFASKNLEVDMIIWTGDNTAHDIWDQSMETQPLNTQYITEAIMKYFPRTPVYPMFGNHEAYPANQFDTIGNTSDWLLDQLSKMWEPWLDKETLSMFRNRSYYAAVNHKLNVKVIALNTQVCDTANFYLIRDPTDPLQQLKWLRSELYDSEKKNQSVFIMGHIPPGDFGCSSLWSARYRALVDRFTNIIRGQFFGHTHNDHVQIVRSYLDNSAVGSIYIAPSFTTYHNLNPGFRVYEIDQETNLVVNYTQYRLDLNKWNQNRTGPIEWDAAYNVLQEYNLTDLTFDSLDQIVNNIKSSVEFAEKFVFHFESGAFPKAKLTLREIHHYYCLGKHSVSKDALKCLGLNVQVADLLLFATQLLPGAWHIDKC